LSSDICDCSAAEKETDGTTVTGSGPFATLLSLAANCESAVPLEPDTAADEINSALEARVFTRSARSLVSSVISDCVGDICSDNKYKYCYRFEFQYYTIEKTEAMSTKSSWHRIEVTLEYIFKHQVQIQYILVTE